MALALLTPEAPPHAYGQIASVAPASAAARAGLAPGDWLLTVNGHRLRDVIDFRFYTADDDLTLEVRRGAVVRTVRLLHGPEDPLGLELRGDGLELITECNNHCPFCFVTQLPKGMRRTLSIKDDDYRYSFLFANFVTLTNLTEDDWARIGEQHLSPLYVSVHNTDARMRRKLLGNRFAQDPLEQIDRLGRLGVTVHTQLVLCPGINDGEHLDRSIADLMARYPQVRTIAAVLQRIVDEMNTIGNLRVDLHVVRNRLFGDEVTASGLIVGRDLLAALAGHALGDTLVLPRAMFDHGGTLTLDEMTLDDLRAAADRPIATVRRVTELREVLAA